MKRYLTLFLLFVSLTFATSSVMLNLSIYADKYAGSEQPYYMQNLSGLYFEVGDAIRVSNFTITNLENRTLENVTVVFWYVNGSFKTADNAVKLLETRIPQLAAGQTVDLGEPQCGWYGANNRPMICYRKFDNDTHAVRPTTPGTYLFFPEVRSDGFQIPQSIDFDFFLNGRQQFFFDVKTSSELSTMWLNQRMLEEQKTSSAEQKVATNYALLALVVTVLLFFLERTLELEKKDDKEFKKQQLIINSLLAIIFVILLVLEVSVIMQLQFNWKFMDTVVIFGAFILLIVLILVAAFLYKKGKGVGSKVKKQRRIRSKARSQTRKRSKRKK